MILTANLKINATQTDELLTTNVVRREHGLVLSKTQSVEPLTYIVCAPLDHCNVHCVRIVL